jgi:hypothetical protein
LKLLPTNADRLAFEAAVDHDGIAPATLPKGDSGHILTAYAFFRKSIDEWVNDPADGVDQAGKLNALATTLWSLLRMVVIALEPGDDAQIIFETLNARGTPLLAADLVKNYLFRQIQTVNGPAVAEDAYHRMWGEFDKRYWREEIGQGRSRRPRIDVLLTHWLVLRIEDEVSFQAVYANFRAYADKIKDALGLLTDLDATAEIYARFDEYDPFGPEGTFFHRLEVMETTTFVPVVLRIFGPGGIVDPKERRRALAAIESWLVRRMICRKTTKNYNTVALNLLKTLAGRQAAADDIVGFLLELSGESQIWPSDDEVRDAARATPFYTSLTRRRLRMVLDAIEASMHGPKVGPYMDRDRLTIEHILPQAWDSNWPLPPGIDPLQAQIERDTAKHRLGNLALVTQALNSALSNAPWISDGPSKRAELAKYSQYLVNKDAITSPEWDEQRIRDRGEGFATSIIQIWPKPGASAARSELPDRREAVESEKLLEPLAVQPIKQATPFTVSSGSSPVWTNSELVEALGRYERECENAGLRPLSVQSYVDYSRRFLRWRMGDYRPRDAVGPSRTPSHSSATVTDLKADLNAYEIELSSAHLQPRAIQTYLVHADQFVRWLEGRFVPGANLGGFRRVPR